MGTGDWGLGIENIFPITHTRSLDFKFWAVNPKNHPNHKNHSYTLFPIPGCKSQKSSKSQKS
ncbi:hypothetical protein OA07_24400 [Aphanizomenon flos-aquae 2012/KM1/D3]|nr:hypothetical protein OA07_24400 [Aphanizomenon flos-aquae 2012/KM1/D3]